MVSILKSFKLLLLSSLLLISASTMNAQILDVPNGGTGATTAAGALANLTAAGWQIAPLNQIGAPTISCTIANGGEFYMSHDSLLYQCTNATVSYAWTPAINGAGTVTSVGLTMPGVIFNSTVPGSPVTTSGTLAPTLATQTANTVLAGPATGSAATPAFRAIVPADMTGTLPVANGGTGTSVVPLPGQVPVGQPSGVYAPETLVNANFTPTTSSPMYAYCHFQQDYQALFISYSMDGVQFNSVSAQPNLNVYMRDPACVYSPSLNKWFFVATANNTNPATFAGTAFYYFTSTDLVNFSTPTLISMIPYFASVNVVWAPNWFIDPATCSGSALDPATCTTYAIVNLGSGGVSGGKRPYNGTFNASTGTFGAFRQMSITSGATIIDASMFYDPANTTYYLLGQYGSNVNYTTSSSPTGTFAGAASGDVFGWYTSGVYTTAEAPQAVAQPQLGAGVVNVYSDNYYRNSVGVYVYQTRYVQCTADFTSCTAPAPIIGSATEHGSIIALTTTTPASTVLYSQTLLNISQELSRGIGIGGPPVNPFTFTVNSNMGPNNVLASVLVMPSYAAYNGLDSSVAAWYGCSATNGDCSPPLATNAGWLEYSSVGPQGAVQYINSTNGESSVLFGDQLTQFGSSYQSNTGAVLRSIWKVGENSSLPAFSTWPHNFFVYNSGLNVGLTLTNGGTSGYTTASALPTTTSGSGSSLKLNIVAAGGVVTSATIVQQSQGPNYAMGDKIYPTQSGSSGDAYFTVSSIGGTPLWIVGSEGGAVNQGEVLIPVGIGFGGGIGQPFSQVALYSTSSGNLNCGTSMINTSCAFVAGTFNGVPISNTPSTTIYLGTTAPSSPDSYSFFAGTSVAPAATGNSGNVGIGPNALSSLTSGGQNVAIGNSALQYITTPSSDVAVGWGAGQVASNGTTHLLTTVSSVFVGGNTRALADADTNECVFGYGVTGHGSNTCTIGNTSILATYLAGSIMPSVVYSHAGTQLAACSSTYAGGEAVVSDASVLTVGTAYSPSAGAGSDTVRVQCTYTGSTYAWQSM